MAGWSYADARQAWQLKKRGYDVEQIALAMGFRPTTVLEMVSRWEARIAQQSAWHYGLSIDVVNRLKRNGIDTLENFKQAWMLGDLQNGLFPEIGPATIRQIRIWLTSPSARKAFRECSIPIVVNLSPEALEALNNIENSTHEDRSEIINGLILAADEQREC